MSAADLPTIDTHQSWPFWLRAMTDPELTPRLIVTGQQRRALLLPWQAAATVAAAYGQADMSGFRLGNTEGVLLDLIYRAARLRVPTAITHQGRRLVAIAPLFWAQTLTLTTTASEKG